MRSELNKTNNAWRRRTNGELFTKTDQSVSYDDSNEDKMGEMYCPKQSNRKSQQQEMPQNATRDCNRDQKLK